MLLSKRNVGIVVVLLFQFLFCVNGFAENLTEEIQATEDVAESESTDAIINEVNPYRDADWLFKDIGDVTIPGTASGYKFDIIVDGAGKGIQGREDSFHFVYQKIKGDFTIESTKVYPGYDSEGDVKLGIMVRESLYSDSAYMGMFLTKKTSSTESSSISEPTYLSQIQIRKYYGNNTKISTCNYQNDYEGRPSKYRNFKINRTGDKITCYSLNEKDEWIQEGSPTYIEIGNTAYVGMCVTSENPNTLVCGKFGSADITQNNKSIYTKPWESISSVNKNSLVNLSVGKKIYYASSKDGFIASNAIDGNDSTKWSVNGLEQSLQIDLENIYDISSFEMLLPSAKPYRYSIETSVDGCHFTKVIDKAKNTSSRKLFQDNIKTIEAQYVKLTIHSIYDSSSIQLDVKEFRVFGNGTSKTPSREFIYRTGFMKTDDWNLSGGKQVYLKYKRWATELKSNADMSKTISTEGYSDVILNVSRWVKRCEGNERFITEWFDGSTWEVLEDVKGNDRADDLAFILPESASNKKEIKIRFRTNNFDDDDLAYIDKVEISGKPIAQPITDPSL